MPHFNVVLGKGSDEGGDYAGLIVYRIMHGIISFLVFKQTKKDGRYVALKFPGGCMAYRENDIAEALVNELEQETDLKIKDINQVAHIFTEQKVPGIHHKHFFSTTADNLEGDMRKEEMYDDDGDLLGKPYWIDVETALDKLCPPHKKALETSIEMLGHMGNGNTDFRRAISRSQRAAMLLPQR
jgi:hypothetical protein